MDDLDYMDAIETGEVLAPPEVIERVVRRTAYTFRLLVPQQHIASDRNISWIAWADLVEILEAVAAVDTQEEGRVSAFAEAAAFAKAEGRAFGEFSYQPKDVMRHRVFEPDRVPIRVANPKPDPLAKVPGETKAMRRIRRRRALRV